ncbi:hypothetical protein SZ55_1687 [Pseudomonas sp. FeS53a]|nr:hypothetical protein SZ55_1687 [Pseudomonas sp. FeS53a]
MSLRHFRFHGWDARASGGESRRALSCAGAVGRCSLPGEDGPGGDSTHPVRCPRNGHPL